MSHYSLSAILYPGKEVPADEQMDMKSAETSVVEEAPPEPLALPRTMVGAGDAMESKEWERVKLQLYVQLDDKVFITDEHYTHNIHIYTHYQLVQRVGTSQTTTVPADG